MRGEPVGKTARIMQFTGFLTADVRGIIVKVEKVASVGKRGRGDADVGARVRPRLVVLPCG